MRRPVSVKVVFFLSLFVQWSASAKPLSVAILPFALFVSDFSLGAKWVFSFQRVLLPEYRPLFPSLRWEVGPGVSRSHPDSADKLGCSTHKLVRLRCPSLCCCSAVVRRPRR